MLLGLAGVAVSLAGFSGLVIAVRSSAPAGWHPRDIWSLSWMLGASFGALFIALVPVALLGLGVKEGVAWALTDLLIFVFAVSWLVGITRYDRRLKAKGYPPRVRYFPTAALSLFLIFGVAALLGAVGLLPRFGVVVLSVVASLLAAALSLVVFLVVLAGEAGST